MLLSHPLGHLFAAELLVEIAQVRLTVQFHLLLEKLFVLFHELLDLGRAKYFMREAASLAFVALTRAVNPLARKTLCIVRILTV